MANAAIQTRNRDRDYTVGAEGHALRLFFREHESTIGFRSTFGPMLAAESGLSIGTGNADYDTAMLTIIGFCKRDERGARIVGPTKGLTVWRALRELDRQKDVASLVVLHRLYGYVRTPGEYRTKNAFGEDGAAELATLTDAAEEAREKLAAKWGDERASGVFLRAEVATDQTRDTIAHQFWEAVVEEEKWEARTVGALRLNDEEPDSKHFAARGQRATAAAEKAAAWREVQRRALRAHQYDGRIGAQLSCLAGTDREVTIEKAIAEGLADAHEPRRTAFVQAVKRDAYALKAAAHDAYREAKKAARS